MIWIYHLIVLNLHWMAVGHAFESGSGYPTFLITAARAAAFVASIDFCFVLLALLSPLAHTLYQFFNFGIMRHSIHKIHFHMNMSISASFFAIAHILCHTIAWALNSNLMYNGAHIYSFSNTAFVTGIMMVIGFAGAGLTGYKITVKHSPPFFAAFHLPLAGLGFFAFFGHGHEKVFGSPIGDYMVLVMFFFCVGAYAMFFFTKPLCRLEVDDDETKWSNSFYANKDDFALVALKYGNSCAIPPGSFFNIYASTGTSLSYVHGHPFPVLSSRNRLIVFLVQCRKSSGRLSFTEQLVNKKDPFPTSLLCFSIIDHTGSTTCMILEARG